MQTTAEDRPPIERLAANGHLPVSRQHRVTFEPVPGSGRVYYLRPPTTLERLDVRTAVIAAHGNLVETDEVRDCLREAASAVWPAEDAAELGSQLDDLVALEKIADTDRDADDVERIALLRLTVTRAERALSRAYLPLAALLGANERQLVAYSVMTARAVIVDWDGLPVPCRRKGGFVTDDAFRAVPDADLAALLERARSLRELTADLEPGAASP